MTPPDPGDLLRRITRLHTTLQQEGASCCGIHSLTRCQILTTLDRNGSLTLADLSRTLALDKGWLSRTVDDLARSGHVHKQPGSTDKRTITLTLTPRGRTQVDVLNAELDAQSSRVLGRIPEGDRAGVLRALELLTRALEAELEPQEAPACRTC